ncbi:MAG TPA: diguanylate cyclase, partial [Steroidobacteraceae bacterium]|nr:diguanylate cyclase [Steroidobacteraceae bacterium]
RPASVDQGFASHNVMAFTEDHAGRLWVATFDGGITIIDRATSRVTSLRRDAATPGSLSDDRVMALLTDREGFIWAGTMSGGLDRIDPETRAAKVFSHDAADPQSLGAPGVMSLFEDAAAGLWVGTYGGGLSLLNRATGKFQRYTADAADATKLASDRVTALAGDATGLLWVGTDGGGLHVLDPATGIFSRLRHDVRDSRTLSADTVYALHVDPHGTVWVGTRGGGLDRMFGSPRAPQSVHFTHLSEKNGLPNNTVYGIHSDGAGRLWISTNYGLAQVDPLSGRVRAFHRAHGLQGEEFNFGAHYVSHGGQMFFGGANGYNAFLPAALQSGAVPPPIVLTSATVLNRPAITGSAAQRLGELHLGYRDDIVTFEFAALDYAAPLANTFQYRLEGAESGWVDAGTRRSVTYANLGGGRYSLLVRAANADGVWSKAGASIAMAVDPPPWQSSWAYAAYGLIVAMLIVASWVAHRYKLEREARYSRTLEVQVRERTRELATHASALEQANRKLEEASFTDPLTGLGNRRSLKHMMPQMIASNPRGGRLALMVVDLDFLKPINDEHGHEAGDRVLISMSKILRDCMLRPDCVVRWGGDEFVMVHACDDLDAAAELAERVRSAVCSHRFRLAGSAHARTSCSIGFALYPFVRSVPGLL